jgi:hypothetical protein
MLLVEGQAVFENIGNMVASRAIYRVSVAEASATNLAKERSDFEFFQKELPGIRFPIVPGEQRIFVIRAELSLNSRIPLIKNGRVALTIYATCDYGSGEGDVIHKSDGIWYITQRGDDPFLDYGFGLDPIPGPDSIDVRGGLSEAT